MRLLRRIGGRIESESAVSSDAGGHRAGAGHSTAPPCSEAALVEAPGASSRSVQRAGVVTGGGAVSRPLGVKSLDSPGAALLDHRMSILLSTPDVDGLEAVVRALAEWQYEGAPLQLHSGDIGWYWQFGPERTAEAVRTWSRRGRILGVGLLDGPDLVRLAIDPKEREDEALARRMAEDLTRPDRGVLPAGEGSVEALWKGRFREVLREEGWEPDDPWVPMIRDLSEPVEACGLRIEVAGPERVEDRVAVHRGAFTGSKFSAARWRAVAAGPVYADARCLIGYDDRGDAVAGTTVWSAGPGRIGMLEPLGVHGDHQGRGHGRAIAVAAAAALRDMGASSATVCAEGSNTAAVATYRAAGFLPRPAVPDLRRIGRQPG